MLQRCSVLARLAIPVTLLAMSLGCGSGDAPPLGYVEGTITFDRQPLENATVTFTPVSGGRPSFGRTDAEGHYHLIYSRSEEGAMIGEHKVMVSTYSEMAEGGAGGGCGCCGCCGCCCCGSYGIHLETIPARYNVKTELTETVEGGSQTINFDLEPGGEIIQPTAGC